MSVDSTFGFLEQIDLAKKTISSWPDWMQRSAVTASASFPHKGESQHRNLEQIGRSSGKDLTPKEKVTKG